MKNLRIKNKQNEFLNVLVNSNDCHEIVVFVHGFGTNKHEGFELFDDIVIRLYQKYTTIQFDFSSYGESEGKQEDSCISKMAGDLESILEYAHSFSKPVNIIAHSMGVFVTAWLCPRYIKNIIFTSPPGLDVEKSFNDLKQRIVSKNGSVNENGISIYPRTSGDIQKLGPKFWSDRRSFDALAAIKNLSTDCHLVMIQPLQDEIVVGAEGYQKVISDFFEIEGDHNFTKKEDRSILIEKISSGLS